MARWIRDALPWSADLDRRTFLRAAGLGALTLVCPPWVRAHDFPTWGVVPEYSSPLDEFLVVYDQSAGVHLLREIVGIVRHAPGARLHVLVSRARLDEARTRFAAHGLSPEFHPSDEDGVTGDWGRDILLLSRDEDGRRVVHVPWNKQAAAREGLERGLRHLRSLEREDLQVRQLPLALEGGNVLADRWREQRLLFAGSTIASESRALYRYFYGQDPGDGGVADILAGSMGADRVVWIGPRPNDLARQARFVFHIDMLMTILGPGVAVVATCPVQDLGMAEHRERLEDEARRTLEALERRGSSTDVGIPRDDAERKTLLEDRLRWERAELWAASQQMDDAAATLTDLGYTVHRIPADPRRVRRYQSPTNVIPATDRLLVPIYPTEERVHGWVVRGDEGRDQVDVDLGVHDSEFALEGDNLQRVEFYRELHPGVRVVRDYFYMASGNLHCVVGRLS